MSAAEIGGERARDLGDRVLRILAASDDGDGVATANLERHDRHEAARVRLAVALDEPDVGGELARRRGNDGSGSRVQSRLVRDHHWPRANGLALELRSIPHRARAKPDLHQQVLTSAYLP